MVRVSASRSGWKSLLGFFQEDEAMNIIKGQEVVLEDQKQEQLKTQIKSAREYVSTISGRPHLIPRTEPIPDYFAPHRANIQKEAIFPKYLSGFDEWKFTMTEMSKVYSFQANINLEYIQEPMLQHS